MVQSNASESTEVQIEQSSEAAERVDLDGRIRNVALAIMFAGWAIARVVTADAEQRFTLPVLGPALLQCVVAWLFLRRSAAKQEGNGLDLFVTSASLLLGGWLVSLAPPASRWSIFAMVVFGIGTVLTVVSLQRLGRSFAIFPAWRTLQTGGTYNIVRHPAYAGEMIMLLGVALAAGSLTGWLLLGVSVVGMTWRISREELMLSNDCSWNDFTTRVRYRLLPGVW